MPLLLLLLLVLLLLLQTALLLCEFLLLFHGLKLLLELRNMPASSQHKGCTLINIFLKQQWHLWSSAASILLWWAIWYLSVETKLTVCCKVLLNTPSCWVVSSSLHFVMLFWDIMFSPALWHAVLCSAILFTVVLYCNTDLEVLLELSLVLTGQLLVLLLELTD